MAGDAQKTVEWNQGGRTVGPSDPAVACEAVAPDDSDPLPNPARAFYVGTGGDVSMTDLRGTNTTFKNVPTGAMIPVGVLQIFATGTTASDIVAIL